MIDVHTHCHLSHHWGREWTEHWKPVYGYEYPDHTPQEYDEAMSAAGVELSFVFGLRASAAGVITPNEYVEWFCANTQTPTVGFMALDPSDGDVLDQMADGVRRGLRGIKLYPVLARFDPTSTQYDPFYRAATDAGLIVLWHMGATPSPVGSLAVSNPLAVDEVARRHPDLTQIIAHMGHPWQRETLVTARKNRNVFTDVSAAWERPLDGYLALVRAQEWGVVDKLLFGSDYPLWTPERAASGLRELRDLQPARLPAVSAETIDHVLNGDPRSALGLAH